MQEASNKCFEYSSKNHPIHAKLLGCIGTGDCQIDELHSLIPFSENSECPILKTTTFFTQYKCKIAENIIVKKRKTALFAASLSIFLVLTVYAIASYSKKYVDIDSKLWDLQTRTAADYTVEGPLSRF